MHLRLTGPRPGPRIAGALAALVVGIAVSGSCLAAPGSVAILSPTSSPINLPSGTGLILNGVVEGSLPSWTATVPPGGAVTFSSRSAPDPRCEFSGSGVYTIRLQALGFPDGEVATVEVLVGDAGGSGPLLEEQPLTTNALKFKPDQSWGQTFAHDSGAGIYAVDKLQLFLSRKKSSDPQTFEVSLQSSWGGGILWAGSIASSAIAPAGAWVEFDLSPNVVLSDGATYFLRASTTNWTGKLHWHSSGTDTYPNGTMIRGDGSPDSNDMSFRLLGTEGVIGTGVDLGPDREVVLGQHTLDPGSGVTSFPGPLALTWTVLAGDAVLSDPTAATPELTIGSASPVALRLTADNGLVVTFDEVVLSAVLPQGNPSCPDALADTDGDRRPDFLEHAIGSDPDAADGVSCLEVCPGTQPDTAEVRLRLPLVPPAEVRYELQYRLDLRDPWSTLATRDGGGPWAGAQPSAPVPAGPLHEIHSFSESLQPACYFRLKVTCTAP